MSGANAGFKAIFNPIGLIPGVSDLEKGIEEGVLGKQLGGGGGVLGTGKQGPEAPGQAADKFTGFVPTDAFAGTQAPTENQIQESQAATRRRAGGKSGAFALLDTDKSNTLLGG